MSEVVLDASAFLALINEVPAHEEVSNTISDAAIRTVNLSEVAAKLAESGMPERAIWKALEGLAPEIHDVDRELTFRTGPLRPTTKPIGLSLGNRACLALGQRLDLPLLARQDLGRTRDRRGRAYRAGPTLKSGKRDGPSRAFAIPDKKLAKGWRLIRVGSPLSVVVIHA